MTDDDWIDLSEFRDAVVRAGGAFNKARGKDPEIEGKALADFLRSGVHISFEQLHMLADLVEGKFGKGVGNRRTKSKMEDKNSFAIASRLVELRDKGISTEGIEATLRDEFGISLRAAGNYLEYWREQGAIITDD